MVQDGLEAQVGTILRGGRGGGAVWCASSCAYEPARRAYACIQHLRIQQQVAGDIFGKYASRRYFW
jgi:hypothetical protein